MNQYGKTKIQIVDRNGVRTSRWVNNQLIAAEGATSGGMLRQQPQYQRDSSGSVKEVYEDGKLIARYEPQLPGLKNVEAAERYVEVYLARQNAWARVKSSHERPIPNRVTGMNEHWLYGVRLSSREEWEAAKRMPVSRFVQQHYHRIVGLNSTPEQGGMPAHERQRLDDLG